MEANWSGHLMSHFGGMGVPICTHPDFQCTSFSFHSLNWKKKSVKEPSEMWRRVLSKNTCLWGGGIETGTLLQVDKIRHSTSSTWRSWAALALVSLSLSENQVYLDDAWEALLDQAKVPPSLFWTSKIERYTSFLPLIPCSFYAEASVLDCLCPLLWPLDPHPRGKGKLIPQATIGCRKRAEKR